MTIKQLIKEYGFKQKYIAGRLDISEQSMCHKLNGSRCFTEQELEGVAAILEMPLRIIRQADAAVRR